MTENTATWRQLLAMFPKRERVLLLGVFVMSVTVALFETAGVATLLPFMAVVMDPTAFERYSILKRVPALAALDSNHRLVALGVAVGLVIVVSNIASALALWSQQKVAAKIRTRLSVELFRGFLHQPYTFHVTHDGPTLVKVIVNDIDALARAIAAGMMFTSRLCVVVALVALLLLQNPVVAFWTLVVLAGSYYVIYLLVRLRQGELGLASNRAWEARQRITQESLGGIKELQVLGREKEAVDRFAEQSYALARTSAINTILATIPRYILEPITFGGILAVTLVMILTSPNAASAAIPTLALYAFVGYRLLPALQQIYAAAAEVRYSLPSLTSLQKYYSFAQEQSARSSAVRAARPVPTESDVMISMNAVSFTYAGAVRPALKNVNLEIRRGESIGLVGTSGSGKTTLADIILGLYQPQDGSIMTPDGALNESSVRNWRRRLGYVPQHVFLANASVLENIAFGLPASAIDRAAVERAAKMAQADGFINQLAKGLDTPIGERGVVLSGGQRQRLGIARALFNDPEVLVFDEATSALDGLTENAVMDAIHALKGTRTIILIAHRLQTIEACDRIVHLKAGVVLEQGSFTDLVSSSATFREFANPSAMRKEAMSGAA